MPDVRNDEVGHEMDATVRYSILGTVRAQRGETELETGPPKRLALLSLLLLRAPGPVAVHEAVDILWDARPPASAVNVVHRHIGALRRILEPELRSRSKAEHLVRAADGYRLLVGPDTSDLLRFRALRTQAQLAVKAQNPAQAAQDFVTALRLWRTPVVAAGTTLAQHQAFTTVGHEYVATAKEATDVILTAAPELVEDALTALRGAVEHHRFDEALHSRIIAALAATGRSAEALTRFESIRHTLAEELGVEPGPALRAAHQHLLNRRSTVPRPGTAVVVPATASAPPALALDPALALGPALPPAPAPVRAAAVPPAPPAAGAVRPAQLPAAPASFVGRHEALEACRELLPRADGTPPPAMTAVICGMPGIGKTTLAVHWAHSAGDHFPDGQIHIDLQGHHPTLPPLEPAQAMRQALDALGVRAGLDPTAPTGLAATYRSALAGRRVLIVLDDARDCEQVRPLLPGAPGCLAVVTSRRRLDGLAVTDGARVIPLSPLSRREGVELLRGRLGADRVLGELPAAEQIADLCAGLPLALALTGARALARPAFPLTAFARDLRDGAGTLAAFAGHDPRTDVRAVMAPTYRSLGQGAATLFRLLPLHPSYDIGLPAAASLTGTDPATVREHIAQLADHHLVEERTPGRYTSHPLLVAYAAELGAAQDGHTFRSEARARLFEHYLHSADAATALIAPRGEDTGLPTPRPGVHPQRFSDPDDASRWIRAERYVLPKLVRDSVRHPRVDMFRCRLTSVLDMCADTADR